MARFNRRGKSKIYWVPTIASLVAPTLAEINAGTDLSVDLFEVNGFEYNGSRIPTPTLADNFTAQITGEDTVGEPNLVFHDQDNSSTIRTALAKDAAGYIVRMPYGKTATKRAEVWPSTSQGVNDQYTTANESAKFTAQIAVTATPTINATVTA